MPPEEHYEYNPEKRRLSKIYSKQKFIMHIGDDLVIPLLLIFGLFFSGYLESIATWSQATAGPIWGTVLFVFVFVTILIIATFPLNLYASFFYEHKYGLSHQTLRAWLKDHVKETALEYVFLVPIGTVTALLAMQTTLWWLYAAIISFAFTLFLDFIFPAVILPFLYKLSPYDDKKELRILLDICKRAGVPEIRKVKVLKESERSPKANAFFSGLGATKTVILYDTLLDQFTKREIRTVIGHELGHYTHNDLAKFMLAGGVESLLFFYFADVIIRAISHTTTTFPLHYFPLISGVIIVIGFFSMPLMMWYSRHQECAADEFALDYIKDPMAQISTEKRLADIDLTDDNPDSFVEFWFHSHPSAKKRIHQVIEWMTRNKFKKVL
jgi:STE24 endopeptidase